jgi:hypothetical protein
MESPRAPQTTLHGLPLTWSISSTRQIKTKGARLGQIWPSEIDKLAIHLTTQRYNAGLRTYPDIWLGGRAIIENIKQTTNTNRTDLVARKKAPANPAETPAVLRTSLNPLDHWACSFLDLHRHHPPQDLV